MAGLDTQDLMILAHLQQDSRIPLERLARRVGLSKTAVWNRIQRMEAAHVIRGHVVLVNPAAVGLPDTVFVAVRTNRHEKAWLDQFTVAIRDMPEILEAHRLAGDIDYLLKVQVSSIAGFDQFYKKLVARIGLYNVTSSISMEVIKSTTVLPLPGAVPAQATAAATALAAAAAAGERSAEAAPHRDAGEGI